MSEQYWWTLAEQSRHIVRDRLAEAERERLAQRASDPSRSTRARLAGVLRSVAGRLDGDRPTGGRPLAPAAAR